MSESSLPSDRFSLTSLNPPRRASLEISTSPLSSEADPSSPRGSNERLDARERHRALTKSVSARALGMPMGKVEVVAATDKSTPLDLQTQRKALPRSRVFIQSSSRLAGKLDLAWESMSDTEEVEEVDCINVTKNQLIKEKSSVEGKVHRVLSSFRSISFQNNGAGEDLDTAWGQAVDVYAAAGGRRREIKMVSNRWRRPRGRISSKNGVLEFTGPLHSECYSEADANHEAAFWTPRGNGGRLMGKKSLWINARREPKKPPFLVNGGYLAASATLDEPLHNVTAMVCRDEVIVGRSSGDKYVEFIHASAQKERESRGRLLPRGLGSRVMYRAQAVFRRKRR